ncbi:hypothetical protein FGG52_gp77 [Mycobacterium phage Backyardigan]|uniref:Uncharacterized protein n=3 Tax=Backyardiganvirus TaxID=2946815 RepID=A0A345L2Y4_9CAUD|nr:hypothetical protein WILE_78 [Mycobacterium phage Wile]YP_009635490.1 hypothetical protein FGG52_gp77 [Mycobacterium phage Backyardigan]YP_010062809.1 hypothetical protein KIY72_gp79 [Mycobacterium phage Wizard007]AOT27585.1 hypothetical protein SEA_BADGER_78 [Mycobacterium phage Badger]ASZ73712.1 hypothetical protein SEA_MORPHER26_79 [Mycobacterium phage Morpher26]AXH49636.1 hypothetical protein SEA_DRUANTIA_81 [Mycobacterium phage Druantia]AZS11691.1 hypothetical protein SEA_CICI_79 [Myc
MKVFVYFNLHRKMWSVKALEGPDKGRVIARSHYVILRDVTPKVSEAGRQRVLREGKKNVHAGLVGELIQGEAVDLDVNARLVTYNPRKGPHFTFVDDGDRFFGSDLAVMTHKRVYAA